MILKQHYSQQSFYRFFAIDSGVENMESLFTTIKIQSSIADLIRLEKVSVVKRFQGYSWYVNKHRV